VKYLLDTHAFLWWLSEPEKLASELIAVVSTPENEILISTAVLWELAIKRSIGKLSSTLNFAHAARQSGFEILPISVEHIDATEALPRHHRDPFDRILVAQAQIEHAVLITRDPELLRYPVATYWA